MINFNDRKMKKRLLNREEDALEEIIDLYKPLVLFVVKEILTDTRDQSECVSDVFLTVWNKIELYNSNKNTLKNWICSIARYKSIDVYRKKKIDSNIYEFKDDINSGYKDSDTDLVSNSNSIDSDLERKIFVNHIYELLEGLSTKEKEVFIMRFIENLKPIEISQISGLDVNNVYKIIEKSKKKFKSKYRKEDIYEVYE